MGRLLGLSWCDQATLHVELPHMCDQVMLDGQMHVTDRHVTRIMHEPFLASW